MSGSSEQEDRTEAPTQRRLARARDEGRVALSREVPVLAGLATATAVLLMAGPWIANGLAPRLQALMLASRDFDWPRMGVAGPVRAAVLAWAIAAGAIVLPVVVASVLAVVAQVGLLARPQALLPDLSRIDPLAGLRRIFGPDHLMEALKSVVKIGVLAWAGWHAFGADVIALRQAPLWTPGALTGRMMQDGLRLLEMMLGAQLVIAGLDVLWVRLRHQRSLRMSREDVRQENKETEGNPEVRARVRRLRMMRARQRMMAAVPKAAVVVTNPTHFAIALAYEKGQTAAPRVVAKGVDEAAARIREIAREHRIPLVPNPPLARALFAVELDREVPPEHFPAVAAVIAYVWRLRAQVAARNAPRPAEPAGASP